MSNPKIYSMGSHSFLRHKSFAEGLNMDNNFIQNSFKTDVKHWMHLHGYNEREVFFAENLNIKTDDELKKIKKSLSKYISKRLKEEGYTEKELEKIRGIVELHPTNKSEYNIDRKDPTMINSHIHYWGSGSLIVTPFINEFIAKNKLSNRIKNDYSCSFMETGNLYIKGNDGEFYDTTNSRIYIEDENEVNYKVVENVSKKEWEEGLEEDKPLVITKEDKTSHNFYNRVDNQIERMKEEIRRSKEFLNTIVDNNNNETITESNEINEDFNDVSIESNEDNSNKPSIKDRLKKLEEKQSKSKSKVVTSEDILNSVSELRRKRQEKQKQQEQEREERRLQRENKIKHLDSIEEEFLAILKQQKDIDSSLEKTMKEIETSNIKTNDDYIDLSNDNLKKLLQKHK